MEGREFREATHVNRSLLALGAVLSALANKSPHVPYRSSRLTWELREALSRNAHMSIIGHINRYVYTSYIYISYQPLLIYIYIVLYI